MNVSIEDRRHFDQIVELLADLGVRHVRVGMYRDEGQKRFLQGMSRRGINATLITGFASTERDIRDQIATLGIEARGGMIDAVEGINEPNNKAMPWYVPAWADHVRGQQKMLWDAVKRNSETASVGVIGPSICCNYIDQQKLGGMADVMDFGNLHDYFGPENPGALYYTGISVIDEGLAAQRAISGEKRIISTETGWGSRIDDKAGGVDGETQAKYVIRVFFEHLLHGIVRTFDFDFVDRAEPGRPFGSYGMVEISPDDSLRRKPAFFALKWLLRVLLDSPSSPATGLVFDLTGETQGVDHLLLQMQDGSFYLAVWIETMSWERETRRPRAVPTQRVRLHLTNSIARANLVRIPMSRGAVRDAPLAIADGSIGLDVTDAVQLVHLVPVDRPATQGLEIAKVTSTTMIKNVGSGLCFFVVNASLDAGARIAQHRCDAFGNERFKFDMARSHLIEDSNSRNCLVAQLSEGTALTTGRGCSDTMATQSFAQRAKGDGSFSILAQKSQLCVAVPGGSKDEGAQLVISRCDGDASQSWILQAP